MGDFLEQPQSFAIHLHLIEDGDFLRRRVKIMSYREQNARCYFLAFYCL